MNLVVGSKAGIDRNSRRRDIGGQPGGLGQGVISSGGTGERQAGD